MIVLKRFWVVVPEHATDGCEGDIKLMYVLMEYSHGFGRAANVGDNRVNYLYDLEASGGHSYSERGDAEWIHG